MARHLGGDLVRPSAEQLEPETMRENARRDEHHRCRDPRAVEPPRHERVGDEDYAEEREAFHRASLT